MASAKTAAPAGKRFGRRGILIAVGVVILAAGGGVVALTRPPKPEEIAKSSVVLADTAKRGANDFLHCISEDEPSLDLWAKRDAFLKFVVPKHYQGLPQRLRERCIPALDGLRASLKPSGHVPERVRVEVDHFKQSLGEVKDAAEHLAEKSDTHAHTVASFDAIVQAAGAWEEATLPPTPAPFDRFFACAVPGLGAMRDGGDLFRFFAENCIHGDPMAYMTKVQRECSGALGGSDVKAAEGSQDLLAARQFRGPKGPVKTHWWTCAKNAYKSWVAEDGGEALVKAMTDLRDAGTRLAAAALQVPTT